MKLKYLVFFSLTNLVFNEKAPSLDNGGASEESIDLSDWAAGDS
jgi:hypothetical protein